jgi:hypothetical protein
MRQASGGSALSGNATLATAGVHVTEARLMHYILVIKFQRTKITFAT